jgi:hypothetical protein
MTKHIDPRTGRTFGDHGTAADAIGYLLDMDNPREIADGEVWEFIKDWAMGDLDAWPDFYVWLANVEGEREPELQPRTFGRGIVAGASGMFLAFYLLTGLAMGLGMERNLPSMNAAGVGYYALTWPGFVSAACFGTPPPYVPAWAFTFEDR